MSTGPVEWIQKGSQENPYNIEWIKKKGNRTGAKSSKERKEKKSEPKEKPKEA
jgi:hypothetical protein